MAKSLIHIPKDMIMNIEKWNICEKERQGLLNNLNKFFKMRNIKKRHNKKNILESEHMCNMCSFLLNKII